MAAHTAQQKEGDLTAFWANISDVPFSVLILPPGCGVFGGQCDHGSGRGCMRGEGAMAPSPLMHPLTHQFLWFMLSPVGNHFSYQYQYPPVRLLR